MHCPRYGSFRKELYNIIYELNPNFKDLRNNNKFSYLLNSDGPVVKVVSRFFYLASMIHSSVNVSLNIYACTLCLSVCMHACMSVCLSVYAIAEIVNVSFVSGDETLNYSIVLYSLTEK